LSPATPGAGWGLITHPPSWHQPDTLCQVPRDERGGADLLLAVVFRRGDSGGQAGTTSARLLLHAHINPLPIPPPDNSLQPASSTPARISKPATLIRQPPGLGGGNHPPTQLASSRHTVSVPRDQGQGYAGLLLAVVSQRVACRTCMRHAAAASPVVPCDPHNKSAPLVNTAKASHPWSKNHWGATQPKRPNPPRSRPTGRNGASSTLPSPPHYLPTSCHTPQRIPWGATQPKRPNPPRSRPTGRNGTSSTLRTPYTQLPAPHHAPPQDSVKCHSAHVPLSPQRIGQPGTMSQAAPSEPPTPNYLPHTTHHKELSRVSLNPLAPKSPQQ
jgi:hypothetical protein